MKKSFFTLMLFCIVGNTVFSQTNYTFTGNGLWTAASNWHNNNIPPAILPSGSNIYIYTAPGDTCILDIDQTINLGATLSTRNAIFIISTGVNLNSFGNVSLKIDSDTSLLICTQRWMARNLDVVNYQNGDPIPQVSNPVNWSNLTTGAWCYYNNDPANGAVYGKLYNWYAVNDPRGLAPAGWHIPTWQEWDALSNCLGGDLVSGGEMKETGTAHWISPNTGATNSAGFTALPGGWRSEGGGFSSKGFQAYWWSSNSFTPPYPWGRSIDNSSAVASGGGNVETQGFSIRCVKN